MKTILIPSNFSQESVQTAELIAENSREELRFIFTHLFHVSDDIQDLLFSDYRQKEYELVPKAFYEECKMLKHLYADRIKIVRVVFFYGNKMASFRNFLEYNQVDSIGFSERLGFPRLSKNSLDPAQIVKRCGLPLINTDELSEPVYAEVGKVR